MLRARFRQRGAEPAAAFDAVAASVARLAALIGAGALPETAWHYLLARLPDSEERASAQRAANSAGFEMTVTDATPSTDGAVEAAWQRVGLLVAFAGDVGAPVATTLDRSSRSLRAAADLHRTIAVAVAGPAASTRVMLWTPPGALLLAWAFGFDIPGSLLATPLGAASAVIAFVLLFVARRWSRRLIRLAADVPWHRGLGAELMAIGVRAGLPTAEARLRSERHARALGVSVKGDLGAVDDVVAFAMDAGVPLAALLDAEAERIRAATLADAAGRSSALATRLLLPLATLVLPAFVLLAVVPIGLAVLSSTPLHF